MRSLTIPNRFQRLRWIYITNQCINHWRMKDSLLRFCRCRTVCPSHERLVLTATLGCTERAVPSSASDVTAPTVTWLWRVVCNYSEMYLANQWSVTGHMSCNFKQGGWGGGWGGGGLREIELLHPCVTYLYYTHWHLHTHHTHVHTLTHTRLVQVHWSHGWSAEWDFPAGFLWMIYHVRAPRAREVITGSLQTALDRLSRKYQS